MLPVDYIPILNNAVNKKIKMYCANPDYETTENNTDKKKFCMGAIAEIYTKMGGEVLILGKPEEEIYIKTFKYTKIDKSKTIAIGDSLFHDIKGANNFCVDSILVISGIHKDLKTIDKLSKILGALDIAKLNDRLSSIEENMTNLEKSIKKKVNKLEENLELKIKNSSLFSKVFNK